MNQKINEIELNGIKYIPKDSVQSMQKAESKDGMPYVMIRTYSAGVHCGYLKSRKDKEVTLLDSIRIWKWTGAASLSQLAMEGSNDKSNCKFGMPISTTLILTEAIEIIEMTETAKQNIQSIPSWKQ